jgi:hypothetical protein
MLKVHVVPGWAEGNWHFKQLARGFGSNFTLEHDSREADIIIAHSSGCYSLPELSQARLVVILDPPYWPGRSIARRALKHVVFDAVRQIRRYGIIFWLRLRAWNIFYLIIEPWRHVKIWRSLRQTFKLSSTADISIVVRDKKDAYCGPAIDVLASNYDVPVVEAETFHEDCWRFPDKYIEIMEQTLRS